MRAACGSLMCRAHAARIREFCLLIVTEGERAHEAGASGGRRISDDHKLHLIFTQCSPRPVGTANPLRFETMPSSPIRQACLSIAAPFSSVEQNSGDVPCSFLGQARRPHELRRQYTWFE